MESSSEPSSKLNSSTGAGDEGEVGLEDEESISSLQQKISDLNADFGEKRAKFKSLFLQKEQELEDERNMRRLVERRLAELEDELSEARKNDPLFEKIKQDLQKAAHLREIKEEEWRQLCDNSQVKLSKLEEQMSTYELVLYELNTSCSQQVQEMERTLRKLTFERNEIQRHMIELERENEKLVGKHVGHSQILQNEYISLPNSVLELQEMVLKLREDLISIKIGKEEVEGELKFSRDRGIVEEEEKCKIEESLNMEIDALRGKVRELSDFQRHVENERDRYERTISDLRHKLANYDSSAAKNIDLQKQIAKLTAERDRSESEMSELRVQISTLKRELGNNEDLQRDLISLTKSLQMGLETIREAETQVRWQHPDDISNCTTCKRLLPLPSDKVNCAHCGKIYCKLCVKRRVRRGHREYEVCEFCHAILAPDSAPYFSTELPKQLEENL